MNRRLWMYGMVTLLLSGSLTIAQELRRAPGAQVTTVSPGQGFFTEPAIAVNPRDRHQVVGVFQDNAHATYSTDAGKHWTLATGVESTRYRVSGDVSTAFDTHGHAFICYMAFDKLGSYNYWAHNASRNGLYVRRSLDGGKTWETDDIPVIEQAERAGMPWEDKPYLVADTTDGPHSGTLYVGWTRWTLTDSEIMLSRSTDDGKTWSQPIEIDNHPGLPRDDNGALEGFAGAVAPDGTFYAVWSDGNHLQLTSSKDGGRSFSKVRDIIDTAPIMFQVQSVERSNGFPQIAIDPRGNTPKLYVTWSDYRNGDVDVFASSSSDSGKTWSPAKRVNNDPLHNGADQYFQWLAVDPKDGSINVLFYDRRRDPTNRTQIVVLARSTDGGQTFTNYAWSEKPFNAEGVFMGDYTGIAAYDGRVYGIWTEKPEGDPAAAASPEAAKRGTPEYWKAHGTTVQIGVADFLSSR